MNLELWNLYTIRPARIPASMGDWLLRTVVLAAEILAIEGCLSRVSLLWTFDAGELPRSKQMNPQPGTHEQHNWILWVIKNKKKGHEFGREHIRVLRGELRGGYGQNALYYCKYSTSHIYAYIYFPKSKNHSTQQKGKRRDGPESKIDCVIWQESKQWRRGVSPSQVQLYLSWPIPYMYYVIWRCVSTSVSFRPGEKSTLDWRRVNRILPFPSSDKNNC